MVLFVSIRDFFFLRSGQAVNFARPESKFLVPCAQIPSFPFDNAKVHIFQGASKFLAVWGEKPRFSC